MKKKKNSIWALFASVQLALFTLFILAAASIIGTILPQDQTVAIYTSYFSEAVAKLGGDPLTSNIPAILTKVTFLLDLDNMYYSYWFNGLILLLSLNILICSIERLPDVWKIITMDNLRTKSNRLQKMRQQARFTTTDGDEQLVTKLSKILATNGWATTSKKRDDGTLLFSQKGPWTRLGVYIVHTSLLVIFAGATIGSFWGAKGGVNIPETLSSDKIYQYGSGTPIELGFTVRCNWFTMSRYVTGAPKEYESELTILEGDKEILTRTIQVNDPLSYKGWTFYQSSFEAHKKFLISVANKETGKQERFLAPVGQPVRWSDENLLFAIRDLIPTEIPMTYKYDLLTSDGENEPEQFILADNTQSEITPKDRATYVFKIKEFYSTGLQVSKDPGVWVVYIGCGLMLFGLAIAFFMSHRRIWLLINPEYNEILLAGGANKNKIGFTSEFDALSKKISAENNIEVQ